MRAALASVRRMANASRGSQLPQRGSAIDCNKELSDAIALCDAQQGLQLQQERNFSAPMFRSRGACSPWSVEHERQTTFQASSGTSTLSATAAWQASVWNAESSRVEDWLAALHQVDCEARNVCYGLLSRHPMLLWKDAQRTTGVVQALMDATRQRHLSRPYTVQDNHILALADRYTPEGLRARLSELHRLVWEKLDDANVASLFSSRTSLDMLDLDAKALALKAQALRVLVPEFLPSTIFRSCPELLDVQVDDLPSYVHRAGDVVVIGEHVGLELVNVNNVVIVRSRSLAPQGGSPASTTKPFFTVATTSRVLRSARCGAKQLLQETAAAGTDKRVRELVRVFCNARQLVFAGHDNIEVRVEEPPKKELRSACSMTLLQRLSVPTMSSEVLGVAQASAGVQCASSA